MTDLAELFREWIYDENDNVRFLTFPDGREVMQIRLPLGVEQYELDGRPDGKKIGEKGTELTELLNRKDEAQKGGHIFTISDDEYSRLQKEAILYYRRYYVLFQTGFYQRVVTDAEHNLKICSIVETHFQGQSKNELLQYKPYILRIHAVSRAMLALKENDTAQARIILEDALAKLKSLERIDSPIFDFEMLRSFDQIKKLVEQVEQLPFSERDNLEIELREAVEKEDYERAAMLRDRIRKLKKRDE